MVLSQGAGSSLHCSRFLLPDMLLQSSKFRCLSLLSPPEKTRWCSEGVMLWLGLRHGGEHTLIDPEGSCTYSTVELLVRV